MTATILNWPRHMRKRCDCADGIERACCVLFTCAVCQASEGELPTDCPGHEMPQLLREAVQFGVIDFQRKRRGWVNLADDSPLGRMYPDNSI